MLVRGSSAYGDATNGGERGEKEMTMPGSTLVVTTRLPRVTATACSSHHEPCMATHVEVARKGGGRR